MRMHIHLDDALVAELDERVGPRRRGPFIVALIRRALEDERRWDDVESALGAVGDGGHHWDEDPGEWVRSQRRSDGRRSG
jgi:Arc/MetJ family transcription regulator